ncbi:MAG: hypothetical protein IKB02_01370 [Clostridia bacterium]|nr:hypothetical protein [Clostridia bacterium]
MKKKEWNEGLNYLDPDLIEKHIEQKERLRQKNKKPKSVWLRFGAIAACFLLIASAVIAVPMMFDSNDPPPSFSDEGSDQTDIGEAIQLEKYYDYQINDGMFAPYIGGKVIEEGNVGSKLENVVVTAGWKNEAGEWLTVETLNAEVYAIACVESDVAVALKFIDQGEAVTTTHYYTLTHPNAEYNGTVFPDYIAENPVRYLEESSMGKSNGWQDFGLNGEIRTITVPVGSSYVYQMYSYYIRNDLKHIYWNEDLPDTLEKLPEWLSDSESAGRRTFWYSMGLRIPVDITVEATSEITSENGIIKFLKAEYTVQIKDGLNEKEEHWVIYFMEEDGVYSAYAVLANENFDFVKSYSESIVKSYQNKQ